jgi:hypothetical protein
VRLVIAVALLAAALLSGCRKPGQIEAVVDSTGRHPGAAVDTGAKLDALLGGRVRIVGAKGSGDVKPGEKARLTLYFLVERDCAGSDPSVFVHVAAPGAEVNQAQADHKPAVPLDQAKPGDLVVDAFDVALPSTIAVDELVVWAGLYEGKERWPASPSSSSDGHDRVEIARLHVVGAPPYLVAADVHKRGAPIVVDGKLDEPDWQRAQILGPFAAWDGKSAIDRKTTAKLLWDENNLYLAFIGEDPDVFTPYTKRDDPLYESEAVEIFIDADGDKDVYVELQAAPANDVHFDAAFAGGRRQHMDKSYNVGFETKTVVDERGFTSEWRIPVKEIRDVPAGEPKIGASWKVNLFRLERVRDPGRTRVVKNEASAWSSPLSGDFHNLDRFATITFVD